jgi:hypothetical protein
MTTISDEAILTKMVRTPKHSPHTQYCVCRRTGTLN